MQNVTRDDSLLLTCFWRLVLSHEDKHIVHFRVLSFVLGTVSWYFLEVYFRCFYSCAVTSGLKFEISHFRPKQQTFIN
jgi:hypothetical protein